jgi:hypothetical protein
MCWSADVSLKTFLFSACVFVLAWLNGFKRKIMFLYFSFILMQLIEFFLWRNLKNEQLNRLFSFMAFGLLAIHPFAFCIIITDPAIQRWFFALYIVFLSLTLYIHTTKTVDYSVSVAENGHLRWNWVKSYEVIYYIYLIFFFALLIEKEYIAFIIIFATYIYSIISYYQEGTFSSLWCWTANMIGIFIILRVLQHKDLIYIDYTQHVFKNERRK